MTAKHRKKLYVWCQFFYPELISTGQVITELFERLSDRFEIEVHCAQPTLEKSVKISPVLDYRGIKVVRLWSCTLPKIWLLGKLLNQFTYSASLICKALTLPNGSRINVFTDPFFLPLLLYILQPIKKFKYTITLFDLYPETISNHNLLSKNSLFYKLWDHLTNMVYVKACHVITIGRCMQEIVSKRPIHWKRKPVFIPIWCDTDNIRRKTLPRNYFRELWNVEKDAFLVGYSGNLAKFHPIETFMEAANLLRDHEDIKFIFVGEGAKKKEAQSYCQKNLLPNCHFQTYVKHEQLGSLLAEFDCGLVGLNRNQTGLSVPSKTIALMTAGVPVIACVDETSETALMINENNCGWVCEPESSAHLAETILKLKKDTKQYKGFRQNATGVVNQKFHIQQIVESYNKILLS